MLSRSYSFTTIGIDSALVEVEIDLRTGGQEAFTSIVGLPDTAVKESKERLFSAITNAAFKFPRKRILINLAPADIKKHGPVFDLPMAIGILIASDQLQPPPEKSIALIGELALDGSVRPVRGALSVAIAARKAGIPRIVVPRENATEAGLVPGIDVFSVGSLGEAVKLIESPAEFEPVSVDCKKVFKQNHDYGIDFKDIKGQEHAKRATEIAVAGGHNMILIGPPGSGKSMLAKRIATVMPEMSLEEAIETTRIHSVRGLLNTEHQLIATRPFRTPHHTISDVGLIGGGANIEPGEVSLANNGVLFLDEFPEFSRRVLEVLRQPLEGGTVTISRAAGTLTFPAKFMLIAAMNPCPCGYLSHPTKSCTCSTRQISNYRSKLSGPLLDRIDIHVEMPAVDYRDLVDKREGVSSENIRDRCRIARDLQRERFFDSKITCNARMNNADVKKYCQLGDDAQNVLKMAVEELGFSARAYHRVLRVSRTIADMAHSDDIKPEHVLEAVQYRNLDRSQWHDF